MAVAAFLLNSGFWLRLKVLIIITTNMSHNKIVEKGCFECLRNIPLRQRKIPQSNQVYFTCNALNCIHLTLHNLCFFIPNNFIYLLEQDTEYNDNNKLAYVLKQSLVCWITSTISNVFIPVKGACRKLDSNIKVHIYDADFSWAIAKIEKT